MLNHFVSTTFRLTGLTCDACVKIVRRKIMNIPTVTDVEVDLSSGNIEIIATQAIQKEEVVQNLTGTHYHVC